MEIQQEIKEYSKWLIAASKCVSSHDFWLSFVLSEQIYPSNKKILEMNNGTSPVGGREEAISFENELVGVEKILPEGESRIVTSGGGRVPDRHPRRGRVPDRDLRRGACPGSPPQQEEMISSGRRWKMIK